MDTLLCNAFNLQDNMKNTRVLKFNDNLSNIKKSLEPYNQNQQRLDWDCIPRNKPLAFVEAIHDLPNLKKTGRSNPSFLFYYNFLFYDSSLMLIQSTLQNNIYKLQIYKNYVS